jgi:hypothetical protein
MTQPQPIYEANPSRYDGVGPWTMSKDDFFRAIVQISNGTIPPDQSWTVYGNPEWVNHGKPLPPGTYTVKIVVDPENQISESNEANNENVFRFVITETLGPGYSATSLSKADMAIFNLMVETTSNVNDDAKVIVGIKNQGEGIADLGNLKSLSNYNFQKGILKLSGMDAYVLDTAQSAIPDQLQPGGSFQLEYRTYLDLTPRTYLWTFEVNPRIYSNVDPYINEENYENNIATYQVIIGENRKVTSITRQ